MSIKKIVAKSIKESDSYFLFANYDKQALSVINDLKSSGYIILPKELDEKMLEAGKKSILYGNTTPTELVKLIYKSIISLS